MSAFPQLSSSNASMAPITELSTRGGMIFSCDGLLRDRYGILNFSRARRGRKFLHFGEFSILFVDGCLDRV